MASLLLITEIYPLGSVTEPSFIRPEIEALCREFDRVVVAPTKDGGVEEQLPANATVTRRLAGRLPLARRLIGTLDPRVWRNVIADRRLIKDLRSLRGSVGVSIYMYCYRRLIQELMAEYQLDPADTLIYTFWFNTSALAASRLDGVKCVTRAHGHDLYHGHGLFLSDVLRAKALERLSGCYPVSENGSQYMRNLYPGQAGKISTRMLGSREPLGLNPEATVGAELTLLSVARVGPEKRIPLMATLLKAWAASRPDLEIRWIHVGDGDEMPLLRETVATDCPANLTVELPGAAENEQVHRLMASRHVDALLMTSIYEGAPVAIFEALSYGIPVISTEVGGVAELVAPEAGALLSPTPTAEEFIAVMDRELPLLPSKRLTARQRWERLFSARKLRDDFAREIRGFLKNDLEK